MKFFILLLYCIFNHYALPFSQKNNIPPRLQWNANHGYCGEVALISAGLYYGQYISQYRARALALNYKPQTAGELLLGVNAQYAATHMHLKSIAWHSKTETNTNQFLVWVKNNVARGYPVAIGVYTNEYLFYGKTNPLAGDPLYDHIVPVTGFSAHHPLTAHQYYGNDIIYFNDNGLWGRPDHQPYKFNYELRNFKANRRQANLPSGTIYSIADNRKNFGLAITGVIDIYHDTLPVRVKTNVNYEKPAIKNGSNSQPLPMPLTLTVIVSDLQPHVLYNLYKYNNLECVPHCRFNANCRRAHRKWKIKINSGTHYTLTDKIMSNDIAVYRAVRASAP